MLASLTSLVEESVVTPKSPEPKKTKKVPWNWDVVQKAFDDIKAIIAKDVALAYPDYSKARFWIRVFGYCPKPQ